MEGASQNELMLVFLASGLGMLALAGGMVLFILFYQKRMLRIKNEQQRKEADYQKELLKLSVQSQENERRRIARELHDEVGAMLSTAKLSLAVSAQHVNPELAASARQETRNLLDETIESVRRISRDLLPHTLQEFGLIAALQSLAKQVNQSPEWNFELTENLSERLLPDQELALFRIVQELTNNTIKHADASKITLSLSHRKNQLYLLFQDNGKGFVHDPKQSGIGLKNMRSRAEMIQAQFDLQSTPGKGTRAEVTLTIHPSKNTNK